VDVNSGRTQQALDQLAQALKVDPGNPEVLVYKARALRDLGRHADAQEVYRGILKERPNFWPAYVELGNSFYRQGNYAKAAEVYAEGSVVAPRVAFLLNNLGSMYLLLDRKKDAEDVLLRSTQIAPSETAYSNLGAIAFSAGEYHKALDYYIKARDLRPTRDTTWRNIGDCYAVLGDKARVSESYGKAAELLTESLKVNARVGPAWMNLAFYQAKLGRRAEAEKSMQNAEARGAGDLPSQFKKAQVFALLGRKEEAVLLVLDCMAKGLSRTEVELALDLKEVRNDPRYQKRVSGPR
jgi:tetratricopeptide (TPR) repeat protein